MIPRAGVLALGGTAAVVIALASLKGCDAYNASKQAEWKASALKAANMRVAALRRADSANMVYAKTDTTYLRGRDVLLNPPPGRPAATPEVRACFALSDDLRSKCELRHDADTAALHATERELDTWKHKPDPINPRLTLYGEGLYDLVHAAPVFRAGVQFRLPFVNSINLTAAGDLAIPPAGQSKVTVRGLVGIHYQFR
jgi:hypothetical protein